jgi:flavin reductase (DIM6/NTAB) family NADH-FMN oxidoreductase RutF
MMFDFSALPAADAYKILASTVVPRPIAWISTLSADGVGNVAPYSFFNVMGHDPPILAVGMLRHPEDRPKDTPANILATREFVVNLVNEAVAEQMNITTADAPPEVDEAVLAGLTMLPSAKVKPRRIAEAAVNLECVLFAAIQAGPHQWVMLGQVVCAHVADRFVLDATRCHIDTPALGMIGRMHGSGWYARTTDLFQIERVRWADLAEGKGG